MPAGDTQLKELGSSAKEVYKTQPNTPRKNSGSNGTLHGTIRDIPTSPQKYAARKKGQLAHCRPGLQPSSGIITFDFNDRQGRTAPAEYIDFNEGNEGLTSAQGVEFILRYDNAEFRRLKEWNLRVGKYMIQHYIYGQIHGVPCTALVTEENLFPARLVIILYRQEPAVTIVSETPLGHKRVKGESKVTAARTTRVIIILVYGDSIITLLCLYST